MYFSHQFCRETAVKIRPGRLTRSRADRRNTVDCAILNQMIIEPSIDDKRADKRSLQLQRDFERDLKTGHHKPPLRCSLNFDDASHDADNEPTLRVSTVPKLIESCSRFMSVKSRPVGCRVSAPPTAFTSFKETPPPADILQNRKDFHETFSNLIKLGSLDKPDRTTKIVITSFCLFLENFLFIIRFYF